MIAGAVSHVVWDLFTHESPLVPWIPMLLEPSPLGPPWFKVLQYGSGVVGTVVAGWMALHIGRHRLLTRWRGEPPRVSGSWASGWWIFAGVAVTCAVAAILLPGGRFPHILMSRCIWGGILAASVATLAGRHDVRDG